MNSTLTEQSTLKKMTISEIKEKNDSILSDEGSLNCSADLSQLGNQRDHSTKSQCRMRKQDGLVLLLSGVAEKKTKLLVQAKQETSHLSQLLLHKEAEISSLFNELQSLKSTIKVNNGLNYLLQYKLNKCKVEHGHSSKTDNTDASSSQPFAIQQAWLLHWMKSRLYCQQIIASTDVSVSQRCSELKDTGTNTSLCLNMHSVEVSLQQHNTQTQSNTTPADEVSAQDILNLTHLECRIREYIELDEQRTRCHLFHLPVCVVSPVTHTASAPVEKWDNLDNESTSMLHSMLSSKSLLTTPSSSCSPPPSIASEKQQLTVPATISPTRMSPHNKDLTMSPSTIQLLFNGMFRHTTSQADTPLLAANRSDEKWSYDGHNPATQHQVDEKDYDNTSTTISSNSSWLLSSASERDDDDSSSLSCYSMDISCDDSNDGTESLLCGGAKEDCCLSGCEGGDQEENEIENKGHSPSHICRKVSLKPAITRDNNKNYADIGTPIDAPSSVCQNNMQYVPNRLLPADMDARTLLSRMSCISRSEFVTSSAL